MRVFITGATGFIGTALNKELLANGHQVLGLARSEEGATALKTAGVHVHHGSLEDLESLKAGARHADAVVHLAFNHDFTRYQQNCEDDRRAIEALASVLVGKPLLVTSGIIIAAGVAIPYSVVGEYLGFTHLPGLYWPLLIASLILYACLTQSVKFWLLQRKWI